MQTLTYVLLFVALLLISIGGVGAIIFYDRRKQRELEKKHED